MKLKVFEDFRRHEWIEADTIDKLKASIMDIFSLRATHLSHRLLVPDQRDLILNKNPITGCVDLLQLADGSILDEDHCNFKDGDTLVLGWKSPCIVRLVTDHFFGKGHNIKVDNSFTLLKLKRKIERLTGDLVTAENLPEVLFNGGDDKPLLFFGYYRFSKACHANGFVFEIHRSKHNIPVGLTSLVKFDANGNKFFIPIMEDLSSDSEEYKKNIEKEKNKKRKRQGTEGDKEEASSYVIFQGVPVVLQGEGNITKLPLEKKSIDKEREKEDHPQGFVKTLEEVII